MTSLAWVPVVILAALVLARHVVEKPFRLADVDCGVFLVSVSWRVAAARHVREVLATGPWPVEFVTCESFCVEEPCAEQKDRERSVACAHQTAYRRGIAKGHSCVFVVEDDAQLVPNFWAALSDRLEPMLRSGAGLLWLDFMAMSVADFGLRWERGRHWRDSEGLSVARQFDSDVALWPAGCVWGAGGYIMSKKGLETALFDEQNHFVSEEPVCRVAKQFGGYLSSPPLVWQCSKSRHVRDSVQSPLKHLMDQRARLLMLEQFRLMLEKKNVAPVSLPEWILEDCVA